MNQQWAPKGCLVDAGPGVAAVPPETGYRHDLRELVQRVTIDACICHGQPCIRGTWVGK